MQALRKRVTGGLACRQGTCPPRVTSPQGVSAQQHGNGSVQIAAAPAHRRASCVKVHAAADSSATAERTYDVYVNDLKPLKVGESKHVLSVFVADEAGLINRVAGVFGRRGANIESLAVGLTVDKALFTIVVTGTEATASNLVKQLSKLVKVRYVEDITKTERLEREMMLLKVNAPPGSARSEVLQTAQIFRARVNDVADRTLTLCVSGDPGKVTAFEKAMHKFGIVEIARTGRVCLRRGEIDGPTLIAHKAPEPVLPDSPEPITEEDQAADVYIVDQTEVKGVWEVGNLLEATYNAGEATDYEAHTLSIEVADVPGVLNQVTSVFARRGYNIQSLAVGSSEREGMSRILMVVPGTEPTIAKLLRQLNKLVFVQSVKDLTLMPFVNRELLMIKVRCSAGQRGEVRDLAAIFRADILDVSANTLTIEILGKEDKMKALTDLLEPYGILEIARTGRIAVARDSGVDSKLLENLQRFG